MRHLLSFFTNPILLLILSLLTWLYFSNWNESIPLNFALFVHPFYHIIITILLAERFTKPILNKIDSLEIINDEIDKLEYEEYINSFKIRKDESMESIINSHNVNFPTLQQFTFGKHISSYLNNKFSDAIIWCIGLYLFGGIIVIFVNNPPYSLLQIFFGLSYWILLSILFYSVSEGFIKIKLSDIFGRKYYDQYFSKNLKTIFLHKTYSSLFILGLIVIIILIKYFSK